MLLAFQNVGLEPFLTLDKQIFPQFVTEFYHSLEVKRDKENYPYIKFKLGGFTFELTFTQLSHIIKTPTAGPTFYTNDWSLNSLSGHFNNRLLIPKPERVKQTIIIPRITKSQLQRDLKKLFHDDLRPDLKGWESFKSENVFCILGNKDHVNACTAYMLYYLVTKKTFDLTTMIILRMEDVKKNSDRLMVYLHVSPTCHESFRHSKENYQNQTKKVTSASLPSSLSSNEDEEPSFLEFYDELPNEADLTNAQKEKRGMFKCMNRWFGFCAPNPGSGHFSASHGSTDLPTPRSVFGYVDIEQMVKVTQKAHILEHKRRSQESTDSDNQYVVSIKKIQHIRALTSL
ncbi:hypothetical protein Tco_0915202 [Tanacetum coccineum]